MKLPRWLIISMLAFSLLTTVAAVCWWVTWPERTAGAFVRFFNQNKFDEASTIMATKEDREHIARLGEMLLSEHVNQENRRDLPVLPLGRTWSDVFLGRGFFQMGMDSGYYVQRGRVSFDSFDPPVLNPPIR